MFVFPRSLFTFPESAPPATAIAIGVFKETLK
jgi:hypothetical protein